MRSIKYLLTFFYLFIYCFFSLTNLYSNENEIDISQPLRIERLLPLKDRMYSLAIEPAIPEHFIALSPVNPHELPTLNLIGELNSDDFYWGSKSTLLTYFKNRKSLSEPIFGLCLTPNMTQPQFGHLDETKIKDECSEFNRSGKGTLSLHFGSWGYHPYCVLQGTVENNKIYMAYVGLNHESGAVLLIHLLVPPNPSPEMEMHAMYLWQTFFQKTEQLPEPLLYKAHGQELHTGFTQVKILDRTIKVTAERRKSDKCIRFAVIPQDPHTEFKLEATTTMPKGRSWRLGDPMLKLKGAYILDQDWLHLSTTTSIFIKDVDEFTPVPLFKSSLLKDLPMDPITASLGKLL